MPLPRIHPRETAVKAAEIDLAKVVSDTIEKHKLTEAEALRVVNNALSGWIAGFAKYAIRAERHLDDPEKPGGWA